MFLFGGVGLLQFVLSSHGFPQLCHKGHVFMRYKTVNDRHYWKCSQSRILKCKAKIVTHKKGSATELSVTHRMHNHGVIPEKFRLSRRKRINKNRTNSDDLNIKDLTATEVANTDAEKRSNN